MKSIISLRRLFVLCLSLSTTALAQLPSGMAVYSEQWNPAVQASPSGGLVLFHPIYGGCQPITGLPGSITGSAYATIPSAPVGPGAVLVRERDGVIFVGMTVRQGRPLEIHQIRLSGNAVHSIVTHPIGIPTFGALVDQMAWTPDGDLLFSHRGAISGLPREGVAKLDLSTGAVTSIVTSIPTGFTTNALAVDPNGSFGYLGIFGLASGPSPGRSQILKFPLGGGPSAPLLPALVNGIVVQLQFDGHGTLWMGTGSSVMTVDPSTGIVTVVGPAPGLNAMDIDQATGDPVIARIQATAGLTAVDRITAGRVAPLPAGCSGVHYVTGIAVRESLRILGSALPNAAVATRWQIAPSPGGIPLLPPTGSNAFSLTLDVAPDTQTGILVLGIGATPSARTYPTLGALHAWIDPSQPIVDVRWIQPSGAPTATHAFGFSLPSGLPTFEAFAQPFHWNGGGWTGGEALAIGVH